MLGEECLAQREFEARQIGLREDPASSSGDPCGKDIAFIGLRSLNARGDDHVGRPACRTCLGGDRVGPRLMRHELTGEVAREA